VSDHAQSSAADVTPGSDQDRDRGSDPESGSTPAPAPELSLDRGAFREHAAAADGPTVIRVAADLPAGTEPLTAYAALDGRSDYGFLLESARKVASSDPDGAFAPEPDPGEATERHARYSFVGYDPEAVVSVYPDRTDVASLGPAAALVGGGDGDGPEGDTLDRLRAAFPDVERRAFPETDRQQLSGGFVGFLAYDAVYDLRLAEVGVERPEPVVPDAQFCLTTRTVVFDHAEGSVRLVLTPVVRPGDDPDAVYDDLRAEARGVAAALADADDPEPGGFRQAGADAGPRDDYERAVRAAKRHVRDGDVYQGVISRTRRLSGEIDPLGLYAALREINPSPYMYLLRHDDRSIVGASPETLVSVRGERVVSNPIAGTCPRGASPVEDRRLAGEMLADEKERAEHTMLVDLARNDVRRASEPGSVRVEEFMNVLKYSHVQHIESTVTGRLATDRDGDAAGSTAPGRDGPVDAFDATRATFPAGTLTGAPKVRAMEIIDALEREPRGVYGGGVGYYSWTGDADFAIVIRTATVEHGSGRPSGGDSDDALPGEDVVTVRAGAGIVADSVPEREYEETERKMDGVLDALARIREGGSRDGDAGGVEPETEPGPETEPEPDAGGGG